MAALKAANGHTLGVFGVQGRLTGSGLPLVILLDRTGGEHPMSAPEALELAEMLLAMARRAQGAAAQRAAEDAERARKPLIHLPRN